MRTTMLSSVLALALFAASGASAGPGLDHGLYQQLLDEHTREVSDIAGTRVDYAALRSDPDWRALVASLAQTEPAALPDRAARLAFWINVYNILTIDLVVQNDPEESIRDIGSLLRPVWKRPAGRVGTREVSLDEVEHQILRPMGEPRIHGAIVCASLSCPSLAREPFRADRLEAQLDASVSRWLADPLKGARLDAASNKLWVSRIFKWFAEDFEEDGGVRAFLERHGPPEVAAWSRGRSGRLRYLDYDWRLNALP